MEKVHRINQLKKNKYRMRSKIKNCNIIKILNK